MKKNGKKLIALLSVACVATAAAAFAGCDKSMSAYEIAKEQGWFTGTEEEFKSLLHVHTYGDEIEVVVAPTGESDGLGYKVCAEDGHKEYVVLAKLAGVIPSNPIEIAVGETKAVTINTYDGVNEVVSGKKGVMYFKTTVDKTGYIAMPTNVPEGVEVAYTFYYDGTFAEDSMMSSRNVWVEEVEETEEAATADVYVKMEFTSAEVEDGETAVEVPAVVEVTAQHTVLDNEVDAYAGKIKHTVKLSQGTASELKVFVDWGYYKAPVTLFKDGEVEEGSIGDYKAFDGTDTATVWLEPGEYVFEIDGLAEGFCLADEEECVITLPDDGSKDKDCEYVISVGKTYEYNFTVTDTADAAIEGASVIVLDAEGEEVTSGTTNAEGKVAITLGETKNAEGAIGMNYSVVVKNLGFGLESPEPVALTADTLNVTVKAVAAVVDEWETTGTTYAVFVKNNIAYATVTLNAAKKYTLVLEGVVAYTNYKVLVGGVVVATKYATSKTVEIDVDLAAAKNEVEIKIDGWDKALEGAVASFKEYVASAFYVGQSVNMKAEVTYSFTAPAAGTYTFTFANCGGESWGDVWADEATASSDFFGRYALRNGDGDWTSGALTEGQVITFYSYDSFTVTVAAGGSGSSSTPSEGTPVVLGESTWVDTADNEGRFSFTSTTGGTYTFFVSPMLFTINENSYLEVMKYGTWETIWNGYNNANATFTLAAGESLVFVTSVVGNSITQFMIVEA